MTWLIAVQCSTVHTYLILHNVLVSGEQHVELSALHFIFKQLLSLVRGTLVHHLKPETGNRKQINKQISRSQH